MKRLRAGLIRLAAWFGRTQREREWTDEFESHVELHIDDNLRAGMSHREARRAALAKFGSLQSTKESMRERATFAWIETFWQDARYAVRNLRRSPGFATTAILSLALGLGSSLAVFTVADNFLARPLPYPDTAQLVTIWEENTQRNSHHSEVSPGNYLDWKAQTDMFSGVAGVRESRSVVIDGNRAEEFGKQRVTADLLPLLGVQPVRGRFFTEEEDRASIHTDTLLLISYRLWQRWFDADDNVIGRKVQVNSVPRTIIGVLPPGFFVLNREVDLWEPLGLDPAEDYRNTQGRWMTCVIARLHPNVSIKQARAHMTALATRLEAAYPAFNKNWSIDVESLRDSMYREVKTALLVLLGSVGLLLAVACANVANLLLARYSARRREIGRGLSTGTPCRPPRSHGSLAHRVRPHALTPVLLFSRCRAAISRSSFSWPWPCCFRWSPSSRPS